MGFIKVWGLVLTTSLAGANATAQSNNMCRPIDIPAGTLSIGPLSFEAGSMVVDVLEQRSGAPALTVALDDDGAAALADLTRANVGKPLTLKIDNRTIASPIVTTPILKGILQVSGSLDRGALEDVAQRLSTPCS